ncbi:4-hydroxy-2-oxoheptanedioate aldolase (plasmid) [Deinococcus taeanensis]|uniref:4-hydroxy-2-oxoheptanedioate aldolase n=1 Tax=Deinococcus taeanensis TaxID=2737050 RepID=UPI001CDCB0A9|nr:4-hydroxy-2-oxoheptanedioate aldolase [Deinococcus taeanensis]UBV45033.1 4-hydroxy-2-oxoheptanedioate aldolase [Deinococcus taeanensis]
MTAPDLHNPFKAALARREAQIGLWLALGDPYSAEIVAGAGLHWLLIDGEHAPNDVRSTLSILQALAAYPVTPVVRPPIGHTHLIKQYLDLGVQTLLIPMVETAAQARDLVAATHYPPRGVRGVGSAIARASRWNAAADYVHHADEQVCLLVQVESAAGLAALDDILTVDGVDGVFIGPADLSASLGHRGNPGHPEVQGAILNAVTRITAAGRAAGILCTEAQADLYLQAGCTFVAVGVDTSLLARATRDLASRFCAQAAPDGPGSGPY